MLALLLAGCNLSFAATIYVDDGANYYISAGSWGAGGLPTQPNAEWRLADGLDYDTIGTGANAGYRNYGSTDLATELTNGNVPSLSEGILAPHQSAGAFDGVDDGLQINSTTILDMGTQSFSVAVWANVGSASYKILLSKSDIYDHTLTDAGYRGWSLIKNGTTLAMYVNDGGGDAASIVSATTTDWTTSKWMFVLGTWDIAAKTASIYVNGALKDTTIKTTVDSAASLGAAKLTLGNRHTVGPRSIDGDIALAQVWQNVLVTANEALAMFNAMKPTGAVAVPYPSVQSAVYQATAGDRILVQPGVYRETLVVGKALEAITAVTTTFGNRPTLLGSGLPAAAGTVGVTLSAAAAIGFFDLRGYTTAQGVKGDTTSDGSVVHHLTIDSCLYGVDFDGAAAGDSLLNCTIDGSWSAGYSTGFRATTSSAVTVVVLNNIIYGCNVGITKAALQTLTGNYNDLFGNTTDYSGTTNGLNDLALDPEFLSIAGNNYSLGFLSNIIDRGVVLHGGAAPFNYFQNGADVGAWESWFRIQRAGSGGGAGAWARGAWGR